MPMKEQTPSADKINLKKLPTETHNFCGQSQWAIIIGKDFNCCIQSASSLTNQDKISLYNLVPSCKIRKLVTFLPVPIVYYH